MEFPNKSSKRSNAVMEESKKTKKKYKHFSLAEREEIAIGLEKEESIEQIAKSLGRNRSSIYREIGRNGTFIRNVKYRSNRAQLRADKRKKQSHQKERLPNPFIRAYVESHLKKDAWTPEKIANRLPIEHPGLKTNYESIYLWIYEERRDLIKYLVRAHKRRYSRKNSQKSRISKIPNRVDISERPTYINERKEVGHWEVDTVVSSQSKACVAVMVERTLRLYITIKMKDKSAMSMHKATVKALFRLPVELRKTLTYDNGLENCQHELTNSVLGTKSYFCKPYHSWEKGSIENRNGILRRFFPKKHNWNLTTQKELNKVTDKINSIPVKCLGYKTSAEVFDAVLVALRC
jgi:IS30 family transposase